MDFDRLQACAKRAGLDRAGIVRVGPAPTWEQYRAWVVMGYAGDMAYLTRSESIARRADPRAIMPETQSVLVVAAGYREACLPALAPLHGRVARYAWGEDDYHDCLLQRLEYLVRQLQDELGPFKHRCYVDTGPVLERAWAQAAGLGWQGKNTCLIHPQVGSYMFLGVALLGITLPPSPRPALPSCGSCTRCLDACPTHALVAPGILDSRRCLSYLTIENRGPIPPEFRSALGDTVFGCDICQEVCPWNQKTEPESLSSEEVTVHSTLNLPAVLELDPKTFRARFRRTPIWRATPEGLARNAAIVLGNQKDPAARACLSEAAQHHSSTLVREHAQWALLKYET